MARSNSSCEVIAVGKRRDGGTRYWCTLHRADATAKYGRRAPECRYAHVPLITDSETTTIDVAEFPGGIGVWGAVPPIYDTTTMGIDRGVHVHARRAEGGPKQIDGTFRRVRIRSGTTTIEVDELDAIYFMVSTIFEKDPQIVICTRCRVSHLDKDWFSVHPHRSHLCAACGKTFRDDKVSVGNPAASAPLLGGPRHPPKVAKAKKSLKQADYAGGICVWGSNPAIMWTANKAELLGVHVHAYRNVGDTEPEIDETFASVTVDGVTLGPEPTRILMAQMALPHLAGRVVAARCDGCGSLAFDEGDAAFSPKAERKCGKCRKRVLAKGRFRNVVSNPLVSALARLAETAVRAPRKHDLELLPETL